MNLKPYIPKKSLKRRWYDAQDRQGFPPVWTAYFIKGKEAERRQDLKEADKFYQEAESYDPQNHEFYLYLAVFFEKKGDHAQAKTAFQKSIKYQLFPPP